MVQLKSKLIKSLFAACMVGAAFVACSAQAYVWQDPYYGYAVSNTCVAPNGAYMNFAYQRGLYNSPCMFSFEGNPEVYYGVYR